MKHSRWDLSLEMLNIGRGVYHVLRGYCRSHWVTTDLQVQENYRYHKGNVSLLKVQGRYQCQSWETRVSTMLLESVLIPADGPALQRSHRSLEMALLAQLAKIKHKGTTNQSCKNQWWRPGVQLYAMWPGRPTEVCDSLFEDSFGDCL